MKRMFVVAIVVAVFAWPVSAQEPQTSDTVSNPPFEPAALGLRPSYQECMDAVDPPGATFPMLDCNAAETKYQHRRLNKAYRELIATLPPEHVDLLRKEERAWLAAMRAICGSLWKEGETTGTGQAGRLAASSCEMEEVALRSALLRERAAGMRWKQMFEAD